MTTCDAITDALVVQASRVDSDNAAANLNTLTQLAAAFGGISSCFLGFLIEFLETSHQYPIDPNSYFGLYAGLIFILTIFAYNLDSKFEPDNILALKEMLKDNK